MLWHPSEKGWWRGESIEKQMDLSHRHGPEESRMQFQNHVDVYRTEHQATSLDPSLYYSCAVNSMVLCLLPFC